MFGVDVGLSVAWVPIYVARLNIAVDALLVAVDFLAVLWAVALWRRRRFFWGRIAVLCGLLMTRRLYTLWIGLDALSFSATDVFIINGLSLAISAGMLHVLYDAWRHQERQDTQLGIQDRRLADLEQLTDRLPRKSPHAQ